MYDDNDNERSFWQDEPTRRLGRLPQRALSSRAPQGQRAAQGQRARQHLPLSITPDRPTRRPVDPFLVRLGLILCLGLAMVPVALTVRHGADDILRTAPNGGASTAPFVGGALASSITSIVAPVDVSTVVAQTSPVAPLALADPTPTTVFDIDALPPAVPVNDDGTTATTAAPATTQAVTQKVNPPAATTATTSPAAAPVVTAHSEAPKAETPTTAPACSKTYEVVSGDYWILIASKADVSVKDLLAANNASTSTPLYPGRDICLPKNASTPSAVPATTAPAKVTPTTAKPTTTAAPTTTLPSRTYTAAEVEAIIRDVWPDDLEDEAVRIARRESNLQPTARNACCYGLFQIYWSVHKGWLSQMGVTSAEQLFDPRVASTAGYTLYQRSGGWGPWAV